MQSQSRIENTTKSDITVRPLQETELSTADSIMRLAFGTFIGLPEPMAFMGDAAYVRNRWLADPEAAFAAESGGEIIGSNFATNWGSAGFFGPLTIRPDFWDRGVGKRLMERSWNFLTSGKHDTLVFSRSRIVKSISRFTKGSDFGRAFLPRSCQNRWRKKRAQRGGRDSPQHRRLNEMMS